MHQSVRVRFASIPVTLRDSVDLRIRVVVACGVLLAALLAHARVDALERVVGASADHATIAEALEVARAGDVIRIHPGVYRESLKSVAPGITLQGHAGGDVVITAPGGVFDIHHADIELRNVILDGDFGAADALTVRTAADRFTLRGVEVRRSGHDCIDLEAPRDVTIIDSVIHHCLRTANPDCQQEPCPPVVRCDDDSCRRDAHGIAAGAVRRLTILDTEIHTFSGDAVQVDADRGQPAWDEVTIAGCEFRLAPLPEDVGGFAAGIVPGENAIDTKTPVAAGPPSRLTIRDTIASGFRGGLVRNAAFNLKENVAVDIDGVTVYDSQIAFRIRGANAKSPFRAAVALRNVVVYDVATAFRYESGRNTIALVNSTIGRNVARVFDSSASASGTVINALNVLVVGRALPPQITAATNLAIGSDGFVDAAAHDYRLRASSPAVGRGSNTGRVPITDRDGRPRVAGEAIDPGAFEYQP